MLELNAIQTIAKPDRVSTSRQPDTSDANSSTEVSDQVQEFETEYESQSKQQGSGSEADDADVDSQTRDKPVQVAEGEEPVEVLELGALDDEGKELIKPDPEAIPALIAPTETLVKKTKGLSENAFEERLTQAASGNPISDRLSIAPITETQNKAPIQQPAESSFPGSLQLKIASEVVVSQKSDQSPVPTKPILQMVTEDMGKRADAITANAAKPQNLAASSVAPLIPAPVQGSGKTPSPAPASLEFESRREIRHEILIANNKEQSVVGSVSMPATPKNTTSLTNVMGVQTPMGIAANSSEKVELSPVSALETDAPVPWENRVASTSQLHSVFNRPETPAMVGRQLAEAMQRFPDRPVELALNPEELGRVRMSISASDMGITVTVLAERPETLDLMRRHIDQLAREFQAIGYDSINFAFNEGETGNASDGDSDQDAGNGGHPSDTAVEGKSDTTITPITLAASSGLDMRL